MTSGERSGVQLATVFNGSWTKVAAASAMQVADSLNLSSIATIGIYTRKISCYLLAFQKITVEPTILSTVKHCNIVTSLSTALSTSGVL